LVIPPNWYHLKDKGVLTKADIIQDGLQNYWLNILHNNSYQTEHGYYMTRQKTPKEREEKLSHAGARKAELHYFDSTIPWCKEQKKQYFGVENLLEAISSLLSEMIAKRYTIQDLI
jgi:hypothetical protein